MINFVKTAVLDGSFETLQSKLAQTARESFVAETAILEFLVTGWEAAVEHFLNDGGLDPKEETRLVAFISKFNLSHDVLNRKGAFLRVVEAGVVRDILEGKIPNRMNIDMTLPFKFQKSERLIWVFKDVDYLEDRTKTEYKGGSQGISVRIMKGVYYRVGAYKGRPVSRTERLHVDTGWLAVTTKHIYFSGPKKSLRVRHEKIVSLNPYSDGIAIVRDSLNAKPQIFVTGDGWFIHNLLANISQLNQ